MKYMKVLVHQQPYQEILKNFGLEKLLSLRWSSSPWFLLGLICLWIATLEIVLPNHTWNMIISSKPCFVIIKIKINQTLVSQYVYNLICPCIFIKKLAIKLIVYVGNLNQLGLLKNSQKQLSKKGIWNKKSWKNKFCLNYKLSTFQMECWFINQHI